MPPESGCGGGCGIDGAIHCAAGPLLRDACALLGGCRTGEVKITRAFDLPARRILHTVGPKRTGRDAVLALCYTNSLDLAAHHACRSVAFPCISTGAFGFDRAAAAEIAMSAVRDWLQTKDNRARMDAIIFSFFTD